MFPEELKQLKQWCIWKYETRGGKKTKIPYSTNNRHAKSNDESTWADYESARAAYFEYGADGIGFFFNPPYIGIDIDNIAEEIERFRNNDITENIVSEFYEGMKSYGEISPSGEGVHIILKGSIPGKRRRKDNVEMYDSGRFFTMTGHSLGKYNTINDPNELAIKRIYKKYIESENDSTPSLNKEHGVTHDLTEMEIVNRIYQSKQAQMFDAFMNDGWQEYYASQSEADLAFANLLAFWCARDYTKMDNLFRSSSLMRDKWDEKRGKITYGEGTLYKAINEAQNVFTPNHKKETPTYDINFGTGEVSRPIEYPRRSWDDTGNADRFMDRFGELVKYSYIDNKFIVYDGSKWEKDDKGVVRQLIDATVEDMKNEPIEASPDLDPEEVEKAWQKHLKNSRNNNKKKAMMDELKHRVAVMPSEFDSDDMLLNVENGYIDLSNGELLPHDINKMFSRITTYEYTDKMDAPTWMNFLEDIFDGDQDMIKYIQKAVGYSLTGSTKEQVMFILFGNGRNGKSLFVETLSEILGTYARNIRADSLMVKQSGGVNNDIAALDGTRFVTSSEPNEGFRFDEGLIKQLTGGDKITARFLYGEDFDFNPKFKLWVSSNHKPIIRGTDDGIWRRMVLVPFEVQIPEHKVDKELKYKLLREAPAIIDWAVEGTLLWQKEGLSAPKKIVDASKEYRNEMDVLEQFIDDLFERVPRDKGKVPAGEFFSLYKDWAKENEEYLMSKQKFGKKMQDKFFYKKDRNGRFYYGLKKIEKYPGMNNWS